MSLVKHLLLGTAIVTVLSTGAYAADLSMPMKAAPAMMAPAASSWDGPYIGASVGYGWGTADLQDTSTFDTASPSGFLVGGQVGYNFHLSDQIVGGVEGNIDWVDESASFANNTANSVRVNWEGSVRARLGLDMGAFLPYIEAGVAFANANEDYSNTTNTYTGWTAGAGVEFQIADHLSANVEYRYSDYGTQSIDATNQIHLTDSTVRVGLNYHF